MQFIIAVYHKCNGYYFHTVARNWHNWCDYILWLSLNKNKYPGLDNGGTGMYLPDEMQRDEKKFSLKGSTESHYSYSKVRHASSFILVSIGPCSGLLSDGTKSSPNTRLIFFPIGPSTTQLSDRLFRGKNEKLNLKYVSITTSIVQWLHFLTHWDRVTHIWVRKLNIIG